MKTQSRFGTMPALPKLKVRFWDISITVLYPLFCTFRNPKSYKIRGTLQNKGVQNKGYRTVIGSGILGAAGQLERKVSFRPFWPLEISIGTKLYNENVPSKWTYSLIYILVPLKTSSGQNGRKSTFCSNRPAAPSILDPINRPPVQHSRVGYRLEAFRKISGEIMVQEIVAQEVD